MLRPAAVAVCAIALLAAVSAHVGIDVLGDYLVRDDSYDHVAHGSRVVFTLCALGLASAAGLYCFSQLCTAAASLRNRVRMLRLRRAHIAVALAAIALLALFFVPVMEALDALRAGTDVDSLADAFGGSLLLGISTTLACALAWSGMLLGVAAWLVRHRDRVARLLVAFLQTPHRDIACAHERRMPAALLTSAPARRTRHRAKRGPPAPAALVLVYSQLL
jgi:signal transduction histidine kinase